MFSSDTLDLMDSFNYIKPLPQKSGQIVFLCTPSPETDTCLVDNFNKLA